MAQGSGVTYIPGTTYPPVSLPDTVSGGVSFTSPDSWRLVNVPTCPGQCPDEFFGWENDGGTTEDGLPTGQAITPCPAQEVEGDPFGIADLPDGTVWVTDYEDIATYCRETRDAAMKAKNEFSLATWPFFMSNETIIFYIMNRICGLGCEDECNCSTTNNQ